MIITPENFKRYGKPHHYSYIKKNYHKLSKELCNLSHLRPILAKLPAVYQTRVVHSLKRFVYSCLELLNFTGGCRENQGVGHAGTSYWEVLAAASVPHNQTAYVHNVVFSRTVGRYGRNNE